MNENCFLIYINEMGCDWSDKYHYEFLFSDNLDLVEEHSITLNWDVYPASGTALKPDKIVIHKIAKLSSDIKLDLIQNSDTFSYYDTIDGVIAIGWQNLDGLETYPDKRIYFNYGDTLKSIKDRLYEEDIALDIISI